MTINPLVFDFISKQCKGGLHQNCYGKWQGLGFEIVCSCECGHSSKNDLASESVEGPVTNAKVITDAVIITQAGDHNGDD